MTKILIIGIGGFIGSVVRYYFGGWVHNQLNRHDLPYGTIAINILGCFIIGFLAAFGESRQVFTHEFRLLVFIGILGGFTTFSTFGYETYKLLSEGSYLPALLNVLLQVVVGLASVWLGSMISRTIWN